jgi:hypothetical protein
MKNLLIANIAFNSASAGLFVWLNDWALRSQLEETFITLAVTYGLVTIAGNAAFIGLQRREGGNRR